VISRASPLSLVPRLPIKPAYSMTAWRSARRFSRQSWTRHDLTRSRCAHAVYSRPSLRCSLGQPFRGVALPAMISDYCVNIAPPPILRALPPTTASLQAFQSQSLDINSPVLVCLLCTKEGHVRISRDRQLAVSCHRAGSIKRLSSG